MAVFDDIKRVIRNTQAIYKRREAALYALSLRYAAEALNNFRREQANNDYWINQTGSAFAEVFSDAFIQGNIIGWFLAHGVEYGVYLELCNNGEHAAIRFNVELVAPEFFNDVQALYKD